MENENTQELIKQIQSGNTQTIIEAIDEIRKHGNNSILLPLARLLKETKDKIVEKNIIELFKDIKDQNAAECFIEILKSKEFHNIQKTILSICWQSSLDFSNFIDVFVIIFINEPFDVAFEAYTVIENLKPEMTENNKNIAIDLLSSVEIIDEIKTALFKDLKQLFNMTK
jgi:hypothetical protein